MYNILSQMLIVSVWEGRAAAERRGAVHVREGKRNLRISSLCLWPAPDFRAKPSLKRRSTPGSTFHLSSLREHTKYQGLHHGALQYRPAFHCISEQTYTAHFKTTKFNNALSI